MPASRSRSLAGVHPGCFELFAHEPHPHHQRPEGQERRHRRTWARASTCTWPSWRPMSGSTRTRTSTGSRSPDGQAHGAVRRGQGRCLPRLSARAAGAARPQDRPRDPQHAPGPARGRSISAACWPATRTSSASIRSRPSACCAPSSRPPTSAPPSRSGPRNGWSMAASPQRYDYALQTLTELPYDSWREYDPEDTMRFYALRLHEAGMIKSSPNADHRRGHRLALPERAQARAEGVSRPGEAPGHGREP